MPTSLTGSLWTHSSTVFCGNLLSSLQNFLPTSDSISLSPCFLQFLRAAARSPAGRSRPGPVSRHKAHRVSRSSGQRRRPLRPLQMDGRARSCLQGAGNPHPHSQLTRPVLPDHEGQFHCHNNRVRFWGKGMI